MKLLHAFRTRTEIIADEYRRRVLGAHKGIPQLAPFGRRGRALHEIDPEMREAIARARVRSANELILKGV